MKKILLLAVFAVVAFSASAQTEGKGRTRFSVGLEAGLPIGDAGDVYSSMLGGALKVEIPVASSLFATVSGGYTNLSYKKVFKDLGFESTGVIPLKGGVKYFFGKNFYGAGELGAVIGTEKDSETLLTIAPGVGISYPVSDKNDIDAGIRYESWSKNGGSINQIGFHVALKF
ncbi:MAG TPA: hypothetical protein VF602_11865 [Pedobacter sp.]|jgi:hypothetical protein